MDDSQAIKEALNFKELTEEEKSRRGILGRLFGPVASFLAPTRNGRKYTDELWEKVLKNNIVQELFKMGGLPGEIQHPVDREETDPEKIAIMMPEPPKKDKDGHLIGYFDILDTPCGRIAYQLCKYGFKFGVSSRGSGDTTIDYDGNESVNPDTYTLNAWDLVLIPACKDARMTFVESLNKPTLKQALNEELSKSSEDDKKIMLETLDDLQISLSSNEKPKAANNAGASVLRELKEAIKKNNALESKVDGLQEKLSVSYTKEAELNDEVDKLRKTVISLTEQLKKAKAIDSASNEEVEKLREALVVRDRQLNIQSKMINTLKENRSSMRDSIKSLTEDVNQKSKQVSILKKELVESKKALDKAEAIAYEENTRLNESLGDARKDLEIKRSEYSSKLSNANKLVEKYKSITENVVNRYIESQATRLGVSSTEIKNKLPKSYTLDDIDRVCEGLKEYRLNLSKLPFDVSRTRMSIKESVEPIKQEMAYNPDDEVSADLIALARKIVN